MEQEKSQTATGDQTQTVPVVRTATPSPNYTNLNSHPGMGAPVMNSTGVAAPPIARPAVRVARAQKPTSPEGPIALLGQQNRLVTPRLRSRST